MNAIRAGVPGRENCQPASSRSPPAAPASQTQDTNNRSGQYGFRGQAFACLGFRRVGIFLRTDVVKRSVHAGARSGGRHALCRTEKTEADQAPASQAAAE